jgi:transcriptional regulator with XRE-family HTH domain
MSDTRTRLVAELRRIKLASGLSFARMEARTPYSRASLERYVNGKLWPTRQAVETIATACDADPAPLLRLWDEASAPDEPAVVVRKRRRWPFAVLAGLAVAVGVVVFAASGDTQAAAPSTGCRDFYADIRVYTVGRMCWHNAESTVSGDLTNPAEPFPATVQMCVSHEPGACARRLDVARADKGQTRRYRTTVHLPPGHGTWVRVCLDGYCSEWK